MALEGVLPTGGAGSISHGCGNGNVAILSENISDSGAGTLGYDNESLSFGAGYGKNIRIFIKI